MKDANYLSKNLWWCWNYDAVELFRRINPGQWEMAGRNPVAFLATITQRRFEELTQDDSFIGHMEKWPVRCGKNSDQGCPKMRFPSPM